MRSIATAVLLALLGCQDSGGDGDAPPYALADSVNSAQIFARGVVSSEAPEFATTFTPDGRTVYFNRTGNDRSVLRIYQSTFRDGGWSEPAVLPFSDGTYRDVDPFVSMDGERLYFSSTRPLEGEAPKDMDVWFVQRTDTGWSAPVNPGSPINSSDDEIFVTETRSGTLYFTVFGSGGQRQIHRAVRTETGYGPREVVRFDVPDSIALGNPAIAPDESFIVVASGDLDGAGVDLYVAYRQSDGSFSRPENLGPTVNSEWTDFAPHVTRDQEVLFFTSERPGIVGEPFEGRRPGDLYAVRLPSRARSN